MINKNQKKYNNDDENNKNKAGLKESNDSFDLDKKNKNINISKENILELWVKTKEGEK